MKILIVDDSEPVGARLVALLRRVKGLEFLPQVFSAEQASAAFREQRPGVVLLDLQLKGGTSLELVRDIKEKAPTTLVFVLTAHLDERYRKPCVDAGAEFYLSKATDLPRLAGILADVAWEREEAAARLRALGGESRRDHGAVCGSKR
jgi:DNA-binding NarL/FixJ family response regulator